MMKVTSKIARPTREAADWHTRLAQPKIEVEELEAFSAWRAQPQNRAAYERLEDLARGLQAMDQDPDLRAAAAEALARPPERRPRTPILRHPSWRLAIGGLVTASLAVGAVTLVLRPTYSTRVGETYVAHLDDGSSVQLDTNSAVRVRFKSGQRVVQLLRGQAMFDVARDAARPFVVTAGKTQVTARGTRFDVRRDGQDVRVVLAHGSVEVAVATSGERWRLRPGEAIALAPAATAPRPARVDLPTATSWTRGDLTFHGVTLSEAVAEINRYSNDKIVLSSDAPADRRISGVFPTGDNGDFIAAASSLYDLSSVKLPGGDVRLQPRSRPTS